MQLTDSTRGIYNRHTKEFHSANGYTEHCNIDEIKDSVRLTWKAAKELGADACGHEYPEQSKREAK